MIKIKATTFLSSDPHKPESRALYRAVTPSGEEIIGYLVTVAQRTLFRGYRTKDYIRGYTTGRLHSFRPNKLSLYTGVNDENGKPICNGSFVHRWDSVTDKTIIGQIHYCTDIGAFIFESLPSRQTKFTHRELLLHEETFVNNNKEITIHYKYTIV